MLHLVVGVLSLLFWDSLFWFWQVQAILFALLAVVATLHRPATDPAATATTDRTLPEPARRQPRRPHRNAAEPIREGRGRIRLDDTLWRVSGPDLPVGARVKVVASNGRDLTVEAA